MKDFKDFETLLASDECIAEKKAIQEKLVQECEESDAGGTAFATFIAMEMSRYELRKYHEWVSSD